MLVNNTFIDEFRVVYAELAEPARRVGQAASLLHKVDLHLDTGTVTSVLVGSEEAARDILQRLEHLKYVQRLGVAPPNHTWGPFPPEYLQFPRSPQCQS